MPSEETEAYRDSDDDGDGSPEGEISESEFEQMLCVEKSRIYCLSIYKYD